MTISRYTYDEAKKLPKLSDKKRLRKILRDESLIVYDEDSPRLTNADFARARRPGRPAKLDADKKETISIRLDKDILKVLRKKKNWQTNINNALRGMMGLL
jgi:uncharacterized protein (DUF4415 family)